MIKYIIKKLLYVIPVIFGITLLAFLLGIIMPGDPAEIALGAHGSYTPTIDQILIQRHKMGLDSSYVEQYMHWITNAFTGNLGISYRTLQPVLHEISVRIPNTLSLALLSMFLTIVIGIPLGVLMAIKNNRLFDHINQFLSIIYVSVPSFWIAILFIVICSETFHWLPTNGVGGIRYMIMPTLALSVGAIGSVSRLVRSAVMNEMSKSYILAARSKGIKEQRVYLRHALINSLVPVVASLGNTLGSVLGGSIIIETIFSINGIGKFAMDSISVRDYPALQGYVLITGISFVIINLLVDLIYYAINPKMKIGDKI